ncbi:MAG: hypothetical protein P1U88_07965 [Thalassobaculaceae bacterium]|nr:hypothetical protein [Thalassobaculaceae bacterium]
MRGILLVVMLGLMTSAAMADDLGIAHNMAFLEAFLTRCMPAAHADSPIPGEGMIELPERLAAPWLRGKPGTVWKYDRDHDVLVVSLTPSQCFVVSKYGDVPALKERVAFWFEEEASGFRQDQFRTSSTGEFTASYTLDEKNGWARRVLIQARPVPESGGLALMGTAGLVLGK